jgi:class 3 adenylate cyclase/tetratricopeptide (TPR) repeat protein
MPVCASCGAPLPDGARFCPACGAAATAAHPAAEERKLATVLFADLVGSTALGAAQDPERTRATLDRFYDAMTGEISAAGGTVEKFAGDAVMAAFGAPLALEDHAERALHAALAMQRRLHVLFSGELALRIGVNTGEVVVGRPREGSSFVTGDAVNVAARLEQAAAPGEILVGDRTRSLVRGAFELGAARRIEAKGKDDGVLAAPLTRALSLMRPRGVGGLRPAFVGRDDELDLLLTTYARAVRHGGPHLVTIMASAGVGKTRLVRELWDRLGAESPEPLRRTGRCLAYGHGITYWALGEVLKEQLEILESDSPDTVRSRLGPREILGLSFGLDVGGDLHPLAARDRLHDAWIELLDELTREQPVVVLIEDLHWAEDPLLDLLERLAREVSGPLLLIGTARPELLEARPTWGGGMRNSSLLWLEPLPPADAEVLLDGLVGSSLPASLRNLVVERAEGNPFFVEELVGTLVDRGILVHENGVWHAREPPDAFVLPDTVQAVVAARMDLLPAAEKAALQAAAVCGRIFWVGPVVELVGGAEPEFGVLEERDFVRRRPGSAMEGEREYAFKHALTREVAYGSVPKARRARLHAAFADWLERTGGGRDEHAPLLAHHYAEAVRPEDVDLAWPEGSEEPARLREKGARWLRRAGGLALARYDLDEGISLLEQALELEDDAQARAGLLREIGRGNALGFRGDAFWDVMERSLELTSDPQTQGETYAELGFQTSFRAGMWPTLPDHDTVAGWIAKGLELSPEGTEARAKALCADVFWSHDPAEETAAAALDIAETLGDANLRATMLFARALAVFHAGRYEEAAAWARKPLEFIDTLTDPECIADVYGLIAPLDVFVGRFEHARSMAWAFDSAVQRLSPHHRLHGVALLAELEECAGTWDVLRDLTPRVEQAVEANLATPCIRNKRTLLVCAAAHRHAGEAAEADRIEAEAEALEFHGYDLVLSGPRIRLALLKGDLEKVERLTADLDDSFRTRDSFAFRLVAMPIWLDAVAALGDADAIEAVVAGLERLPPYVEPFLLRARGRVHGDHALLDESLDRFEAMGLDWHAEETRALL